MAMEEAESVNDVPGIRHCHLANTVVKAVTDVQITYSDTQEDIGVMNEVRHDAYLLYLAQLRMDLRIWRM